MTTATGETIRQLREAAGMSRRELAAAADITPVFVSKLEQGERRPSPQTLVKIARALGLSVGDLAAKIAVFQASTESTREEMYRGLLRAAAITGGAAVLGALPLVPGIAATVGAAALAARGRQKAAGKIVDESSFDVDQLRSDLVETVRCMPADQLTLLAAVVEDIWASSTRVRRDTDHAPTPRR